ncbi:MAG: serine hydrolase [Candidatus Pacebacteria bacterium]|nr:serine hydrolase [Candidatus Paceibacterota bacterium]
MNKNIVLITILIAIIILGGFHALNSIKDNSTKNTPFLIDNSLDLFKPFKIDNDSLNLEANIVSSVLLRNDKKLILYEKNLEEKSAIASLTKLMTAVIVMDNYPLDSKIGLNDDMLMSLRRSTNKISEEHITIKDLLYIMLIESNNNAAEYLASKLDRDNFLILMNEKAKKLKMRNTHFVNPHGLDEDNEIYNTSSAKDLTILISEIIKNYPLIKDILSNYNYTLITQEGNVYNLTNTNILLKEIPYETWGKTGYTEKASECLILMTRSPMGDIIINIIINSNDRFTEMENLINWTLKSFSF